MPRILTAYQALLDSGQIISDPVQAEAAALLDALAVKLATPRKRSLFSKPEPIKSLYMWGGVGRGKSMLMDLFFANIDEPNKRRVHFHEFMLEVQEELNAWRNMDDAAKKRSEWHVRGAGDDPVAPVAKKIASVARVLCFDEFQVRQIADAMILGRLFEQLFKRGTVVVATSNRHPDELYKDGLNRSRFLPFIDLLKTKVDVFELAAARDYRLDRLREAPVWYSPLGAAANTSLNSVWQRLTLGAAPKPETLHVKGRTLQVGHAAAGVARMTFEELCDRPLGAHDYLTLASRFHTLFLEDIPKLAAENKTAAVRFISLIDALYEAKVKLVASAATEPDNLYTEGDGAFEFQRTASRLFEMRSEEYFSAEHKEVLGAD